MPAHLKASNSAIPTLHSFNKYPEKSLLPDTELRTYDDSVISGKSSLFHSAPNKCHQYSEKAPDALLLHDKTLSMGNHSFIIKDYFPQK